MRLERWVPIGVLLAGALLSGAVVGVVAATDEQPAPRVVATPSPTPSPTPLPTPASATTDVRDVASRGDGTLAVLGSTCGSTCTLWTRWATTGWQALRAAPPRPVLTGSHESTLDRLTLGERGRAWVWSSAEAGPVWWTADEGRSWHRSKGADYRAVVAADGDTWLLRSTCAPGCSSRLVRVSTAADLTTGLRLRFPADQGRPVVLRRRGADAAVLVTSDDTTARMWSTTNGARAWTRVDLPQPCGSWRLTAEVHPSGIWLDCQDEPTNDGAPAALWRSTDDGRTWQRLPQPPEFRYGADLTLVSASRALMTSGGRAGVVETLDAGRTWRETLPSLETGYGPVRRAIDGTLFTAPGVGPTLLVRPPGASTWATVTFPP